MTFGRIIRAVSAGLYGQGVTIGLQLLLVPVLLSAWGTETYGVWVIISAIPATLAMSDLGFATTAGNLMTIALAKGDRQRAVAILSDASAVVGAACILLLSLALVNFALGSGDLIVFNSADVKAVNLAVTAFFAYVAVTIVSGLASACFRSIGQMATGLVIYDTSRIAEGLLVVLVAKQGGGIALAATVSLLCRGTGTIVALIILSAQAPWLRPAFAAISQSELRRMARSAVAVVAIPGSASIGQQAIVVIVGTVLGPSAAAAFSVMRTLGRSAVQLLLVVSRSVSPEYSRAFARQDVRRMSELEILNTATIPLLMFPFSLALATYGVEIVRLWTAGRIVLSVEFVVCMTVGTFLHGSWNALIAPLVGINRHELFSAAFFGATILSIPLILLCTYCGGLIGASISMVALETVTLGLSVYFCRKQKLLTLKDNLTVLRAHARRLFG